MEVFLTIFGHTVKTELCYKVSCYQFLMLSYYFLCVLYELMQSLCPNQVFLTGQISVK